MPTTTTLTLEPLTSSTGARVIGLDPRDVGDDDAHELRDALSRFGVLVFRGEGMTVEEQVTFAERFGAVHGHPVAEFLTGSTADPVSVVENRDDKPSQDDQNFHTDYSFNRAIPDLAVLRAEVLPSRGGDTIWTNTQAAYDGLSDVIKDLITRLDAVHGAGDRFWFELERTLGPEAAAKARRAFPDVTHPVVAVHPISRRSLLFVNPGYTTQIAGVKPRESRALLNLLFDQLNDPAFHYRHRWQPGDVVMWDEHATLHMGPCDFYPEHRRLTRVTAGSSEPVAMTGRSVVAA